MVDVRILNKIDTSSDHSVHRIVRATIRTNATNKTLEMINKKKEVTWKTVGWRD